MSQATPSKNEPIDVETAIKFVESLLRERKRDSLTPMQEAIFRCAWKDKEFNEIVVKFGWNDGTVRNTASALWKRLTEVLEVEVTKNKLKGAVGSVWRSHQAQPQPPQTPQPPPRPNWQNPRLVYTWTAHENGVGSVAISPDGQTLATGSWDNTIKLWDLQTGKLQRTLTENSKSSAHSKPVASVIFSPDRKTLISGSYDKTIKLWHLHTGELLLTLRRNLDGIEPLTLYGHLNWIESLALSPDGQVLASGSYDKTIRLWDTHTRDWVHTLKSDSEVISVAFSPDGWTLACGCLDGTIKLWNLKDTAKHPLTLQSNSEWVVSVAISRDPNILFSGTKNGKIEIWNLATGKAQPNLNGHLGAVFCLAISPDGQILASGSWDNTIKLWNIHSQELLQTRDGHSEGVMSVTFSPDGQTLVSGGGDGIIKIWRASA